MIKTSSPRAASGVSADLTVERSACGTRKAHLVNRKRALADRRWDVVRVADLYERQGGRWVRVQSSVRPDLVANFLGEQA